MDDELLRQRFTIACERVQKERVWKQTKLAAELGLSAGSIQQWQRGDVKDFRFGPLRRLSDLSGYPLDWFAGGDETEAEFGRLRVKEATIIADAIAPLEYKLNSIMAFILGDMSEPERRRLADEAKRWAEQRLERSDESA